MTAEDRLAQNNSHKHTVRRTFVHSHSVYFLLFLVGVTLDVFFKFTIFSSYIFAPVGVFLLILGTFLVIWTERTSHNFKDGIISKENFCTGPYCFTRNPTHFGLFFLVMGFGFIANAFFVVLTTIVSFFIEKLIFQNKAEKILEAKYGAPYLEYKKSIKF